MLGDLEVFRGNDRSWEWEAKRFPGTRTVLQTSGLRIPKDSENISCKSGQRNANADATGAMDATTGAAEVAAVVAGVAAGAACKATPCPLARPRTMLRTSEAANWYRLRH